MSEHLLLKWGTLKGWKVESEACSEALQRYAAEGMCVSAAMQHDSPEQTQALCDLIDAIDGPITNDWSGEQMSKDEAKKYLREYGGRAALAAGTQSAETSETSAPSEGCQSGPKGNAQ